MVFFCGVHPPFPPAIAAPAGDQIYQAMNKAMRLGAAEAPEALEFWRPLIWELDQALRALPPYVGPCFRPGCGGNGRQWPAGTPTQDCQPLPFLPRLSALSRTSAAGRVCSAFGRGLLVRRSHAS